MTRSPWLARSRRPAPTASGEARQPGAPARRLARAGSRPRSTAAPGRGRTSLGALIHCRQRGMASGVPRIPEAAAGCRGEHGPRAGDRPARGIALRGAPRLWGARRHGAGVGGPSKPAIEHEAQQGDASMIAPRIAALQDHLAQVRVDLTGEPSSRARAPTGFSARSSARSGREEAEAGAGVDGFFAQGEDRCRRDGEQCSDDVACDGVPWGGGGAGRPPGHLRR